MLNFCGDNIATGGILGSPLRPWEQPNKLSSIVSSRTGSTRGLITWLEDNADEFTSASPIHLVNSGGIGVYGCDHTTSSHPSPAEGEDAPSSASPRAGFLAEVSREWEAACSTSKPERVQISVLRIAPVLLKASSVFAAGGVLKNLLPPFFFGGGGPVGSGEQLFPFIGERDFTRVVIDHVMPRAPEAGETSPRIYNVVAPSKVSNGEFSQALASALGRPCVVPLPGFVVKLLFGRMGEEVLLGGVTAAPKRLLAEGFEFQDGTIKEAMEHAVGGITLTTNK